MPGQVSAFSPAGATAKEALPVGRGVDQPESGASVPTLRVRVTDRSLAAGLKAIASTSGIGIAASGDGDFVVADRIVDCGVSPVILLIELRPAQARAALDALAGGTVCSILPLPQIERLPEVVWAARNELALLPAVVRRLALAAPTLTERQRHVLDDLAAGLSNKQIAARWHVSLATVKRDLSAMFVVFDSRNRLELVSQARSFGFVASQHWDRNRPCEIGASASAGV